MAFTLNLTTEQINLLTNHYHDYQVSNNNNYIIFRANYKQTYINVYKTNTILLQGKNCLTTYNEICDLFNFEKKEATTINTKVSLELNVVGSDEVGTGDFFGGIVVCSCYVPMEKFDLLKKLGVKDSKKIEDNTIKNIAPILMKELTYSYLLLDNMKYNYVVNVKKMNMNQIKAVLHNNVIGNILKKLENNNSIIDSVICDAFCNQEQFYQYIKNEKIIVPNIKLIEKAESKYLSVAAASIIARYIFLISLEKLSMDAGYVLPKGAGEIVDIVGSKIISDKGITYMSKISKINFKNMKKAIDMR